MRSDFPYIYNGQYVGTLQTSTARRGSRDDNHGTLDDVRKVAVDPGRQLEECREIKIQTDKRFA